MGTERERTDQTSTQKTRRPGSYLVNGALACGVMYYALDLSRSGRTTIDWVVLGLVALAVLWNLLGLGRRLLQVGGGRAVWHLVRTLGFWMVGLLNTVLVRPEDVGSWKHVLGWVFILTAGADSVALYRKEQSAISERADEAE